MNWCHKVGVGLLIGILFDGQAIPHEIRPSLLQINEAGPNRFDVLWKLPITGSAVLHLEPKVSNGLLDAQPTAEYLGDGFAIRRWSGRIMARASFDGAVVRVEGLEKTLTDAFVDIRFSDGQQVHALLKPANPIFVVNPASANRIPILSYITFGIEHILTGFDHLSFVLCLVLLVDAPIRGLKTITAFTTAHSITLAGAAMGYVRVKPALIEALVALSIVCVSVELTRAWRGHRSITLRQPLLIAFIFGLLHGFAFAGSLANIGVPAQNVAGALFLFNCGVEVGQLLFVGFVLGLIALWRCVFRELAMTSSRWVVAYAVGSFATYWLFERIASI